MTPSRFNQLLSVFVVSFTDLKRNDPLRLAGATAFFTTFALPPMLIILLKLFGLIVDEKKLGQKMFHAISDTVGSSGAATIQRIFIGMKDLAINWFVAICGFIFLMFVATTLFKVIKDSVNQLWQIKLIQKQSIGWQMFARLKSLMVILFAGILFFAALLADGFQSIMDNYMNSLSYNVTGLVIVSVNRIISLGIVTIWFTLLFQYLPDGIAGWKASLAGGLLTGILFTIGKTILKNVLPYKSINSVFGASGSFVLLLLFVFYSSFIFYYGACFTKQFALFCGNFIKPRPHAYAYEVIEKSKE